MWKQNVKIKEEEEHRLNEKIKKINKDNEGFLKNQVDNKVRKGTKMNKAEFLLNKPILREINQKKKDGSISGGGSLRG